MKAYFAKMMGHIVFPSRETGEKDDLEKFNPPAQSSSMPRWRGLTILGKWLGRELVSLLNSVGCLTPICCCTRTGGSMMGKGSMGKGFSGGNDVRACDLLKNHPWMLGSWSLLQP